MKLAIDIQSLQHPAHLKRGIGRYILCLIRSIIKNSSVKKIYLVEKRNGNNVSYLFEQEINLEPNRVVYTSWHFPDIDVSNDLPESLINQLNIKAKTFFYSQLNTDLILITSFFDGFKDKIYVPFDTHYKLPPIASIIYDLIPLLQSEIYLNNNLEYKNFYLQRLSYLSSIDYIFTISESAKAEIVDNTNFDKNSIFNIYAACDKKLFFPRFINKRKNIDNFLLYTGAADQRKNIKSLIKAYSLLPDQIKSEFSLHIVGKFSQDENNSISQYIQRISISPGRVKLIGYVSDDRLVQYYQDCSLFIFPSTHEGFGLPVLEAMSCGAPVIASNNTSIPEIIDNKNALFNPYDVDDISKKIYEVLSDSELKNNLINDGLKSSNRFSWTRTSELFVKNLNDIIYKNRVDSNFKYDHFSSQNEYLSLKLINDFQHLLPSKVSDEVLHSISVAISFSSLELKKISSFSDCISHDFEWLIEGPYDSSYSLAILNQNFSLALKDLGEKVIIKSSEGPGDFDPNLNYIKNNPSLLKLHQDSSAKVHNGSINSRNMYPPRVKDLNSYFNMMHAYGWEESEIPDEWVYDFNNYLSGITVMSSFVKKILIDNGVTIPISVCGLGVDHVDKIDESNNINLNLKKFNFLHISSCFPRKGAKILIDAFEKSFTLNDDVSLIIKTFPNPHNQISNYLKERKYINSLMPHISIIQEDLQPSELISLYKRSHALVAPSYGEGFGLPIAEAMYFKLPIITTGWGGQMDFCNCKNSWLIDYQFEYSKSHFDLFTSVWAKPSIDHLSSLLKEVYNSTDDEIENKLSNAFDTICKEYSWKNVAKKNIKFVYDQININKKSLKKIGWISTWNIKCGIASYSKNLISNFFDDVIIFAPKSKDIIDLDSPLVNRDWDINYPSLSNLLNSIIQHGISSLVIQFNFGFFDFKEFNNLLLFLKSKGLKIFIILHSTVEPEDNPSKSLSLLKEGFRLADRLLVHTPKDMNNLKQLGIIENVTLFPHGVPNSINQIKNINHRDLSKNSTYVISTFGFCLPNKGFPELIESLKIIRLKGYDMKLNMYTSLYSQDYLYFHEKIRKLINKLGLDSFVNLDTDYKSDENLLELLSKSDLIVFPYQTTKESSSAAVRQALSSMAPTAVTPLSIFDDVSSVVHYLPGTSVEDISQGIIDFFDKSKNLFFSNKTENQALVKWLDHHSFARLAYRLESMIQSL